MKILPRVVLSIFALIVLVALIAYADGVTLPVDHRISVSGTVAAPPDRVYARIADFVHGPAWRPQLESVQVLPKDDSRDAWVEDYGSGQKMQFVALTSAPPDKAGHGMREVQTKDPSYGGTWTYALSPGPRPDTTTLTITEAGYINPPIYRFVMAHILGPTKNLNDYMRDMQAAAK
jgi:hypothetical protein